MDMNGGDRGLLHNTWTHSAVRNENPHNYNSRYQAGIRMLSLEYKYRGQFNPIQLRTTNNVPLQITEVKYCFVGPGVALRY